MKVSPYLIFNGNCKEAVKLYEKAFGTKANIICYEDAPAGEKPEEHAELVMHGILPIGKSTIYVADTTPDQKATFGDGAFACVELDNAEKVKEAFETLKEDGEVLCEAQETFWNKCYGELTDKFGLKWALMIECTCGGDCTGEKNPNCTCEGCNCKDK